jgi:hypothetical protein
MATANKHGRVGVKRRRPTTNQMLRLYCKSLEKKLNDVSQSSVPLPKAAALWLALVEVDKMTEKSKTGVAKKVHDYVNEFLTAHA